MLSDVEVDAIARRTLTTVIQQISDWKNPPFTESHVRENGDLAVSYEASDLNGEGSFICLYMPLDAVRRVVRESEQLLHVMPIELVNPNTGERTTKTIGDLNIGDRDYVRDNLAQTVTLHLIASVRSRIADAFEEALLDCSLIAQSLIAAATSELLMQQKVAYVESDARDEIDRAAQRVANKKREELKANISGLPNLTVERKPGRTRKTPRQRAQEAETYRIQVESAYRHLRADLGKPPTKTRVAEHLREGGINTKGTDSRLNAFNLKLSRLGLNYNDIVAAIEQSLHKNP